MSGRRIILAGGSGFLGKLLAERFLESGCEVVVLTRSPERRGHVWRRLGAPASQANQVFWDGCTLGEWAAALEGADALINLAGRTVNCRYTSRHRRQILESRVASTRILGEALARCVQPPRVWLNSSTATIYKHSLDRPMDEATGEIAATPEARDAFSVEVAGAWESAFREAATPSTRQVTLRSAMVLGHGETSVFPTLHRLVRWGLGGSMGDGKQYVSWIHALDFCRAIEWLMEHDDFCGVVNVTAPNPVPNAEFMRIFREVAGRRWGLPATRWMLEIGTFLLRTETELILKSRRVIPGRLLEGGFEFRFPELRAALEALCAENH